MCSTKKWSTHRLFLHQLENLKFWVCHYKVKPISAKSSLLGQSGSTVPASACAQHQMYRSPHPRIYGHYLGESFEPKHNENKISVRGANSRCRTRTVHIFSSWPGAKGTSKRGVLTASSSSTVVKVTARPYLGTQSPYVCLVIMKHLTITITEMSVFLKHLTNRWLFQKFF